MSDCTTCSSNAESGSQVAVSRTYLFWPREFKIRSGFGAVVDELNFSYVTKEQPIRAGPVVPGPWRVR